MRSLQCVKALVEAGARVDIKCRDGRTALEYAIQEYGDENFEIIKYLIKKMSYIKEKGDERMMSYLHQACLVHKNVKVERVIDLLVANGFDVNAVEGNGRYTISKTLIY